MAEEQDNTRPKPDPHEPVKVRTSFGSKRQDRELEEFRSLMEPPATFENGFTWPAFFGALFVAFLMVPGTMYMGLLAGTGIGQAAQWVTVILFIEVARRANKSLRNAEIFTLFYLAGAAMASPFSGILWHQFYVQSTAAQAHGIADLLPHWYAPNDKAVLDARSLMRIEWLPALGLVVFSTIMARLDNMVLGYGLFRIASDVERLPFPMAPVGAQGILALSEEQAEESRNEPEDEEGEGKPAPDEASTHWRWRVFSIGGLIGLLFGVVYIGLPTITGALLGKPIIILPIPWTDFTPQTGEYLSAVATGLTFDMGQLILGMVLPYFAMVGSFIGLMITFVLNPILYNVNFPAIPWLGFEGGTVLRAWNPGDGTIATIFKNNIDFYFSFTIGISLAIAFVGILQVIRGLRQLSKVKKRQPVDGGGEGRLTVPEGRGDINTRWILTTYVVTTMLYIVVSMSLIGWEHRGVMIVLFFYGFLYTPLISYATARLEGIAGQIVSIPFVREAGFILSGYHGVAVWFLPIPIHDYGRMTVFYRQAELTGTSFWSVWKAEIILAPIIIFTSLMFAQFIWSLGAVPGPQYPYAQMMWDLQAENQSVIFSSTMGGYSLFEKAFKPLYLFLGFGVATIAFSGMSMLGWPTFLIYGIVRGLGQSEPHGIIVQFVGALIGRYYFQKRLGLKWRQYIPVVFAGFSCGMGLIGTLSIGFTFLSKAVFKLPF
ncbi:MAG: hypothetical protein WD042_07380 [Phycisphaeraceae bacterium]